MSNKTIFIEPLQKRFDVDLKNAAKAARNKSYANASDCCGAKLKQEKKCADCGEAVHANDCRRKIVSIGKQDYLIDTSALKAVQETLEATDELRLRTFLNGEFGKEAQDRFDSLVYAFPIKKREAHYKELAALLKGRTAVGVAVFGSNEYEVLVTLGEDNIIRVRKLVEERQRYEYDFDAVKEQLADAKVNDEVIALENDILNRKSVDAYDFGVFHDTRSDFEEKVIEDYVLNGVMPQAAQTLEQFKDKQDNDELARLRVLAGAE